MFGKRFPVVCFSENTFKLPNNFFFYVDSRDNTFLDVSPIENISQNTKLFSSIENQKHFFRNSTKNTSLQYNTNCVDRTFIKENKNGNLGNHHAQLCTCTLNYILFKLNSKLKLSAVGHN